MSRRLRLWLLIAAALIASVYLLPRWTPELLLGYFRNGEPIDRFTLLLAAVLLMPALFERLHLPGAVGLLVAGVLFGPSVLAIGNPENSTVELFLSIGRVFLMFIAGLEVDLRLFHATRLRSFGYGLATFALPMLAGIGVGWLFGFGLNACFLIGSLLASHTLLGLPIASRLGLARSEVVTVTLGATVFTDVASLLVLAVCISVHTTGFTWLSLLEQLFSLGVYGVLVLIGLPWLGVRFVRRWRHREAPMFLFAVLCLLFAAMGAKAIELEDIVGAFFAGLAVNRVIGHGPVRGRIEFLGATLFIPFFFVIIGYRLDLPVFAATLQTSLPFVATIIAALLLGKLAAALVTGPVYGYARRETLLMWSLSLPQVAATLAVALTAYNTLNADGERLITETVLNSVIVLMVVTSVLGPLLTERFATTLRHRDARP